MVNIDDAPPHLKGEEFKQWMENEQRKEQDQRQKKMTQPPHSMERPIILDTNGYIYNQPDLLTENGHFSIKTFEDYQ